MIDWYQIKKSGVRMKKTNPLQWRHNGCDGISNHQPRDYSTVYSAADQRKHQSSASLAFVRRIHRGPVNSRRKGPVTRKRFPFDDVIMRWGPDANTKWALHTTHDILETIFSQKHFLFVTTVTFIDDVRRCKLLFCKCTKYCATVAVHMYIYTFVVNKLHSIIQSVYCYL